MEEPSMSTPPCPSTISVRRNPPRRARPTPATSALKPQLHPPNLSPHQISNFPVHDILSMQLPENPKPETLRVYLRIKPIIIAKKIVKIGGERKNVWPRRPVDKMEKPKMKNTKGQICISINDDSSVTLLPPKGLQEAKRAKSEVFEGFSHVFSADSSQVEVFDKMVKPLVDEFLNGKSGMLAALGPSGSGKTHTVFGSPREPGMVPLALNHIFSMNKMNENQSSRSLYLSMFEISERGKAEKLCDLLQDGGDLSFQQSAIRGLQEVLIPDFQQAECLIARGMLKRATAMTNSNSQSSRSQCVINISIVENKIEEEADILSNCAVLTIVDLAGAEREKKTGNQGARLLESNFINTTSMVFGLCLRSLLEHQKNPKRPLQKHFQSSLLTRYLREYLEGKKQMALILTVKSGEEDYVDSSLLLRQASPYTKIKFDITDDAVNLLCIKRHKQKTPRIEPAKRMKFSPVERMNNCSRGVDDQLHEEENKKAKNIAPQIPEDHAESTISSGPNMNVFLEESSSGSAKQERSYMIMQNFAKSLWKVLKEYKSNLQVAENKIKNLTESLADEKARNSGLEKELKDLKGSLLNGIEISSCKDDSFSPDRSEEKVVYEGQSYQVTENQNQHYRELLADEDAGPSELEINVSCSTEISPLKVDSFSANTADDVHESSSCNASNLVVNSKSQGQAYQSDDQECQEYIGNVDCTEALTDVRKDDTKLKDSGNQKPLLRSPEVVTITKESSPEPHTNNCYSAESNQTRCGDYKSTDQECEEIRKNLDGTKAVVEFKDLGNDDIQFKDSGLQQPLLSFPELVTITKEISPELLTNSCHSVESNQICGEKYKKQTIRSVRPAKAEVRSEFDVNNKLKSEKKSRPSKPSNGEKPKRRLAPASSILLKDLSVLNFEDEIAKAKGNKGDKKSAPNERNITQGSMSLLRLLNSNLHL